MQIPIKRTVERIPGGFMLAPLLAGAVTHTFAPNAAQFFGSFTGALFQGALPILAVFYVCVGSSIAVRSLPQVAKRGGALLGTKVLLGVVAGVILGHFLGNDPVRAGWFAGVSTLAVVAAINDTNGGLYMALMNQYGTAEETAAYSVMGLESGPFLTMVTLGVAGLATFPWPTLLGAVLPLLFGMLVGNLDAELREFLSSATPVMIPFFAFALGAALNLKLVWGAGLLGIGLGLMVLAVSGAALLVVDRLFGGTGIAGVGAATTAGNAAAVPALVAAANHKYAEAAGPATVLVASSVIVTTMLAPVLTAWWDVRVRRSGAARARGTRRLLAIADDLAGAADCAVACGAGRHEAVVMLGDGATGDADVVAIDANTRCRGEAEAAAEMARLVRGHGGAERMLFRKVDSTLRGHVAAELAAMLSARRETMRGRPVAVFAPAFPAQGRTLVDGRLLVYGVSLAETDVWQRERAAAPASVAELLLGTALRVKEVRLERIRGGGAALERAMLAMARSADVLICDAETEEDLAAVASASMVLGRRAMWVGSAGLARQLLRTGDSRQETGDTKRKAGAMETVAEWVAGPTLFVVGSASPVSREQAERLAALAEVETVRVPVAALLGGAGAWAEEARVLSDAVQRGRDVLVLPEGADRARYEEGIAITAALAKLVAADVDAIGGLVATGGETARAVLDAWGVARLRVRGEVENGVPWSIAEKGERALAVVTKAGGFGDAGTLVRCREFLRSGAATAVEGRR